MTSSMPTTVAIIEDNRLLRETLAAVLGRLPDVRVVATAVADMSLLAAVKPQVLLLDVGLGEHDSLEVATEFVRDHPDAKVIVMDLIPMHDDIAAFVGAGVSGFVLKDASIDEFVTTIRSVAAGQKVLPSGLTESLFSHIARDANGPGSGRGALHEEVRLTRREREVIDLISEGLSNKEIAHHLNVATYTVKSHVRNVMEKLVLHTRLQIAAYTHKEPPG